MKNNVRNRDVGNDGIRLAPMPIGRNSVNMLPQVRQEFVLEPVLQIPEQRTDREPEVSTISDYQPKKVDVNKKWKRKVRAKNIILGLVMFLASALILLPYLLGIFDETLKFLPFKYTMTQFDAIDNIINAFKITSTFGWSGAEVNAVWINTVPSLILVFGLIFVIVNLFKSMIGIFGAVRPKKYVGCSAIYLIAVLAIFIASLVGADKIGIPKIDFMQDFIYGFKSSELFSLIVFAVGNLILAFICRAVNPERSGYEK